MSLSHDSYDFESKPHTPIVYIGRHEPQRIVSEFFGVKGVAEIVGETGGVLLQCDLTLHDYNTTTLLQAAINTLNSKAGKLTGTLTETIGGNNRTFTKCTFLGFDAIGAPFKDGSNQHGWVLFGRLQWFKRQRNPA